MTASKQEIARSPTSLTFIGGFLSFWSVRAQLAFRLIGFGDFIGKAAAKLAKPSDPVNRMGIMHMTHANEIKDNEDRRDRPLRTFTVTVDGDWARDAFSPCGIGLRLPTKFAEASDCAPESMSSRRVASDGQRS